jgi:two-component system, cell cycle response regulator
LAALKFEPRILVVEDDPMVASLFRELLPTRGYLHEVVGDAEAALACLPTQSFDLCITDKNLPGMSGIDLLRRIKERDPDVDVIMMTAYADMQSVLAALEAGVYDYLCKPFESIDDVMAKIARALDKRRILLENRRLIAYLTQANTQIDAMNRDLERQVAERTRQLSEANARLEQLSLTDDVTGLYNQRFLFQRLDEEYRRARRYREDLAILMIDVDHFKEVNDNHDHLFGSRALAHLGDVLRDGTRKIDYVVRYGGDEFVVLLPHTKLADAVVVGERLRAAVEVSDTGEESQPCRLTISMGVAALKESQAQDARGLLQAADRALYLAKTSGRNRIAVMDGAEPMAVVAGIR